MTGQIEHDGIIDAIDASAIHVRIISESACSGCHAKGACSAADLQDKLIDIPSDDQNYQIGQKVTITGRQSQGLKAVLWAYVVPTIVLITSMLVVFQVWNNDIAAGASALILVTLYFVGLYQFKDKLTKSFSFHIKQP
jgi:sigma-E factor negative regulatory protein RseC